MLNRFYPEKFGLTKGYLYEILATTMSTTTKQDFSPNTSCMGIRLSEDNFILIGPYPDTTTYRNLKANGLITLNFTDDIYLYALAALKTVNKTANTPILSNEYYAMKMIEKTSMPYIKSAWAVLFCKSIEEKEKIKVDGLGEVKITEFKLKVMNSLKLKESYKYFNRAENLALETIILATRLKIAKERNEKVLFASIFEKINEYINTIKRIDKNESALKAINTVEIYTNNLKN